MGIISRFKDIMSANINALLDKAENPEKMIDQYLRNLQSDLGKVKAETASVMAEETRARREYDAAVAQVDKLQTYAERAVAAGNDNDAKTFLMNKKTAEEKAQSLKTALEAASANAAKMRQMHDKLTADIVNLNSRKDAIKAKMAVAKAQEKINKVGSSLTGVADRLSAFDRMEEKANQMIDKANAMAELNASQSASTIDELAARYETPAATAAESDLEDELAALKAKLSTQNCYQN